jgi:hypothetical protein
VFEDAQKVLNKVIPIKIVADLCAGAFAGLCSTMVNNPIDVVKTVMQGLEADKYNGMMDCFRKIYAREGVYGSMVPLSHPGGQEGLYTSTGVMGFYKGIGPRLIRV